METQVHEPSMTFTVLWTVVALAIVVALAVYAGMAL